MLIPYLDKNSGWRWLASTGGLVLAVGAFGAAVGTWNLSLLPLALFLFLLAILVAKPAPGLAIFGVASLCFIYVGLRLDGAHMRFAVWFYLLVLAMTWGALIPFSVRNSQEARAQEEFMSSLQERMIMAREQYKTGLVVNVTNQKKIQKYFLLNRISRIFGSQLELSKLADVVVKEVQDIIGAERGRYMFAYLLPGGNPPLARSTPAGIDAGQIIDDQFGIWTSQHRTTLLITDAQKDFRFRTEWVGGSGSRSLMLAPLLADGHVTGVLRAESAYPGMFSVDDVRLFTILADITSAVAEDALLYQRTQELSITDGLTGLYLRRFFNRRLEEELARFAEQKTPFSLLILDLDHFKRINDHFGHLAGDQVLVQLADVLKAEARVTDILCRYGGEEFALLLPYTPGPAAMIMAERIRAHVAQQPFQVINEVLKLTVSVGAAGCPEHGTGLTDLVKAADEALYTAKREGRNRSVLFGTAGA